MSMISEQIKKLRDKAFAYGYTSNSEMESLLIQAADTIESLSAKLQEANEELERWHTDHINEKIKNPFAWTSTLICHNCDHKDEYIEKLEAEIEELKAANMERSAEDCSGWISCNERLPETVEYMEFEPTPYMKRLEVAYMTDTVEYLIGFYDGNKWMDKRHNIIKNVIAWKPFVKLPDKHREP